MRPTTIDGLHFFYKGRIFQPKPPRPLGAFARVVHADTFPGYDFIFQNEITPVFNPNGRVGGQKTLARPFCRKPQRL